MYAKYEVDVRRSPSNQAYILRMRDINTNSKFYNLVHVGFLILAAVLAALGVKELTGTYLPDTSYLPIEESQTIVLNGLSLTYLCGSIACFALFAVMGLIDNLRKSALEKLADLSDEQCYWMSEFLKTATSNDVHNYVQGVQILKRPFTSEEFKALVEHEKVSTRE